ncbi:MAG: ATP-binding protein [Nitrososphaerota archaeon]|nr:ATP-binding protein [Nitrososphaerota archaeon]
MTWRPSTYTRTDKYRWIGILTFATVFLIFFVRSFPFVLLSIPTSLGVAILIMRARIQRHFARAPVRQVAYVSLTEPIYHHYQAQAGETEDGRPVMETRREAVGSKRRDIPLPQRIEHSYVDLLKYIEEKKNPSVLTTGQPSMGKTNLMMMLLLKQRVPKLIFSFKANDAYLQLPCPVVDVSKHIPDPFQDPDAFWIAYCLTYPANVMGIMLTEARTIVKNLAEESRNWTEMRQNVKRMKSKATEMQREILTLIEGQIESLEIGESVFTIDPTKDTVLDFSGLDESAKTFYAEIALRQIWTLLTEGGPEGRRNSAEKKKKVLIAIDEVHRLSQLSGELGPKSIIDLMTRQVRRYGMLYTATQNYCDIHDKLRSLYGTRFTFNTSSEKDLDAIRAIDPAYAWTAKELLPYHFIDVTFRAGKEGILPVFEADPIELRERGAEPDASDSDRPRKVPVDFAAVVREKISNGEVVWVSGLAKSVEEEKGADRDAAKLKFWNILLKLLDTGEVQVQRLDDPDSGETVSLYFAKSREGEKLSPLHRFMVKRLLEKLAENGERILSVAESGQGAPDVETEIACYEIETGLKTRTADLEERISALSATKSFVILVPNSDIARSEKYGRLNGPRVVVSTLAEFLRVGTASRDSE